MSIAQKLIFLIESQSSNYCLDIEELLINYGIPTEAIIKMYDDKKLMESIVTSFDNRIPADAVAKSLLNSKFKDYKV